MFQSKAIQLSPGRYLVPGLLLLALLAALPLQAAALGLSGDDAYDPAAGSHPELFVVSAGAASYSGDDAYDMAAGSHPHLFVRAAAADLSGDDAYDPAAGGLAELAGNIIEEPFCAVVELDGVGSYSGDDAYDPAAGGRPDVLPRALACAE